jgi:ribonucleases P/MRP protein subunit RPP40
MDTLNRWSVYRQMEFNVSKCKAMHFGRNNLGIRYVMNGLMLDEVTSKGDLRTAISSNLKVSEQCQSAYLRANRMLGLVKRTIHHRNPDLLVRMYKSLIRPHLEYCSPVWSPHYNKDKSLLERVQHRFTHLFESLKDLPYETRLRNLKLWTLEERRNQADLIEVYTIIHGFSRLPFDQFSNFAPYTDTRGHSQKLTKRQSNAYIKMFSFSARILN